MLEPPIDGSMKHVTSKSVVMINNSFILLEREFNNKEYLLLMIINSVGGSHIHPSVSMQTSISAISMKRFNKSYFYCR